MKRILDLNSLDEWSNETYEHARLLMGKSEDFGMIKNKEK
jgi:hypothetical protein